MFLRAATITGVLIAACACLGVVRAQDSGEPVQHLRPSPWRTTPEPKPAGAAAELPKERTVDLGGGVKLEMVLVPAGEFLMGTADTDQGGGRGEKPQHRVQITQSFYLGKYPVTQEQWQTAMGSNPSAFKGAQNPVERVSWDHCQILLARLNEKTGEQGGQFMLPTEAQWEYACRAGSTTKYFFGDDETQLGQYAWIKANSENTTHPVGQKKPNAWGLYDLVGNVWQWCQDWYDDGSYQVARPNDPAGPSGGSARVLRGAGWTEEAATCPSAHRLSTAPGDRYTSVGVRVALSLSAAEQSQVARIPTKRAPSQLALDLGGGVSMEMFLIPKGEFRMGTGLLYADKDKSSDERPDHRVRITSPFYLGRYPVTQQQWQALMGNNPSHFQGPTNPVENVNWNDCQAFLGKLSQRSGKLGKFQLPTEAQWEYACRAGSTTRYYFGDDEGELRNYAWYREDSSNRWYSDGNAKTQPVGQKRPNNWWLYDMLGNVGQWCQDYYGDHYYGTLSQDDATEDPTGPPPSGHRVVRGASYANSADDCRCARRSLRSPEDRSETLGFRVSLVPAE